MNRINEKWQAIILVTLIIFFLSAGFSSYIIYNKKASVNKLMNIQKKNIHAVIVTIEEINTRKYQERIKSLLDAKVSPAREKMLSAFKQQNREVLFRLSDPFYKILKKEDPSFSSFAWVLPDNIVFLRLHIPEYFGDEISSIRPDIAQANIDHLQNTGYKAGKLGLEYRVTQPVSFNGEHIGVVQLGLKDSYLLNLIKENIQIPAAMVISNEKAEVIELSLLPKFVGQTHTVQSYSIKYFDSEDIDWNLNEQLITLESRNYYILKIIDLHSFSNEPQGSIFVSIDITNQLAELWKSIRFVILLSVVILIVSVAYLHRSLDGLLQKNIDLNKALVEKNIHLETEVEKLSQAVDTAGDAIFMTDREGTFTYVNSAFIKIYGFNAKDVVGKKTPRIFKNIEMTADYYISFWKTLLDGKIMEGDLINKTKDGVLLDIESSSNPVFDCDNNIIGFLSIQRDITERKKIEKQIKSALNEKEILIRELYHRTQNNLQVISSMLSLKSSSIDNETVSEVFTDIDLKIQSMALVHQKLFDSQNLSNINLKDYIRELCELLVGSHTLNPGRISLNFNLENITALIDIAIPLGLILSELAANSMKYAFPDGAEGEINIRLTEIDHEFIELVFADNGVGVPQDFNFRNQKTLGIETICILAEDQLQGNVLFENDNGVSCTIRFKKDIYKERV